MHIFGSRVSSRAHRLNAAYTVVGMLVSAGPDQALKPDASITAAAIAYFALFSLFPFTLLSISIASFSLGPLMDQQLILQRLEFVAPALGQLLGQNIDEIIRSTWISYRYRFDWFGLVCFDDFLHIDPYLD